MTRPVFICCTPGTGHLTPEERVERCRCGHERGEHWFGGGECGECIDRQRKRPCPYFRSRPAVAAAGLL